MADEGLNPWCEDHWNRIRTTEAYDSIQAAELLPNTALNHPDFKEYAVEQHEGSAQDAMMDLAPLCCWLEERDSLEGVYAACVKDEAEPPASD